METQWQKRLMHFQKGSWRQKLYLLYFIEINTSGKFSLESQNYSWVTSHENLHLPVPEVHFIHVKFIYHNQNYSFGSYSKFSQKDEINKKKKIICRWNYFNIIWHWQCKWKMIQSSWRNGKKIIKYSYTTYMHGEKILKPTVRVFDNINELTGKEIVNITHLHFMEAGLIHRMSQWDSGKLLKHIKDWLRVRNTSIRSSL